MSTITVKDATTIYYKDGGKGPAVTFSHGWPLNSDDWDGPMLFLVQPHGYDPLEQQTGRRKKRQPFVRASMAGSQRTSRRAR